MARRRSVWILVVAALWVAVLGHHLEAKPQPEVLVEPQSVPLELRLSDGQTGAASDPGARPASSGVALTQARATQLLKMFSEPLPTSPSSQGFFQRPSSAPPPKTAPVVAPSPFPGPEELAPPAVVPAALQVLSITPQGAVDRAPRLTVSFNRPMIAVSDPSRSEAGDPLGIVIEPKPSGSWRWLGTQTLVFEPELGEFPRATEYRVTVPAQTTDEQGQKLDREVTATFTLPRPKVLSSEPRSSGMGLQPLLSLTFDQPVTETSVRQRTSLRAGQEIVAWKPLTLAEAQTREPSQASVWAKARPGTVWWFTPAKPLRAGSTYQLVVEPGVQSQEGPLLSDQPYSASFSTYAPLSLVSAYPQAEDQASPFEPFSLDFNNALDRRQFDPSWVSVKPPIPDLKVRVSGSTLLLEGSKTGKTAYQVTVSGQLQDTFGQKLGQNVTAKVVTSRAPKALFSSFETLTVLDPGSSPALPVYFTNLDRLDLTIHRVEPSDWSDYLAFQQKLARGEDKASLGKLPGVPLTSGKFSLQGTPDQLSLTHLDLAPHLPQGSGNLVIWLRDPSEDAEGYYPRDLLTWVQATPWGLDLEVSHQQAVALVTRLADGQPVSGAEVRLGDQSARSGDQGTAVLALPQAAASLLQVEHQGTSAFLPATTSPYSYDQGWSKTDLPNEVRWMLFDDRGLYKPGETAHIRGILRQWERGPEGQLQMASQPGQSVQWTLQDPRGNKIGEGSTTLSALGTLDFAVTLPPDTNLGQHTVLLQTPGRSQGFHRLQVQEFRRPEFEVTAQTVSDGPYLLGESATIQAKAAYFSGGSLNGSEVQWQVRAEPTSYTPPGRSDFTFGQWRPWWDLGPWWREPYQPRPFQQFQGRADGAGEHLLQLDFLRMSPPSPHFVSAVASVADVNRQQRSGSTQLLLHPSRRYVGLRTERSFVDAESPFLFEAVVTDLDGALLPGVPVEVTLLEVVYDEDDEGNTRQQSLVRERQTVTSAEVPVPIRLSPANGGTFRIRAEVADEEKRLNRTEYTAWKAGGLLPSKPKVELEALTLVPERQEYEPGETASLLVMAPFAEGEGMVVWSRDGLLLEQGFRLEQGSATLKLPLTEAMLPNVHARVTVVGRAPWRDRQRPAVARGEVQFRVSQAERRLDVEILPVDAQLEPGAEVELQAVVRDHRGQPAPGSEVTLWMVDEAVLGLVNYRSPQPLGSFYTPRPAGFRDFHLRTAVALGEPQAPDSSSPNLYMSSASKAAGGRMMSAESLPPAPAAAPMQAAPSPSEAAPANFEVRKNFDALAVYRGALETDAQGRTTVKVRLPDNLTRYRMMAVAVRGATHFGSNDQRLVARLPVMVRPSLPRFLNFGDRARLPVVVENQTDRQQEVELVGEVSGLRWVGPNGLKVSVPPRDRVEVRFEAEADQVGTAHLRFGAVTAEGHQDAAALQLPVTTPASGEAFATYGELSDAKAAIAQTVQRPDDIWTQFGGLQLSFSSTALSELTDAFLYLYSYPYECAEQKASRLLSIAALHDVLAAFSGPDLPSEADLSRRLGEDVTALLRLQNSDGGWSYWRRDTPSVPFVSLHVAHALTRVKLAGHPVEERAWNQTVRYLQSIRERCRERRYSERVARSLEAYALYLRQLNGAGDLDRARALLAELQQEKDLNLEALGWLWPTFVQLAPQGPERAEIRRLLLARVSETADKAQFTTSYGESDGPYLLLHSDRRTDAILLLGFLGDDPQHSLHTKLVRGLLAHRQRGRWQSTQENAWVLLALQKYFRTAEKETPNFEARAWLDQTFLGQETFQGRSAKEAQIAIPMADLPEAASPLVLSKEGPGRLYYRVGLRYAPRSLRLPAEDRGFHVERRIRGLEQASDVRQNEQGDWIVKAGAKVEVELSMMVTERRYHVALVDPFAAGMEPLNPVLQGTPPGSTGGQVRDSLGWWPGWRWYEHENLRDERAEVFASLLYPGLYTYRYTALATTPGEYVLPPVKAEEMYSPETFGRTATGRLIVEESP